MTTTDPGLSPQLVPPVGSPICSCVDEGLWVVNDDCRHAHLGRIERRAEAYLAYDGTGTYLGAFETLRLARRRVETAPPRVA